jgi:hypothetical protein
MMLAMSEARRLRSQRTRGEQPSIATATPAMMGSMGAAVVSVCLAAVLTPASVRPRVAFSAAVVANLAVVATLAIFARDARAAREHDRQQRTLAFTRLTERGWDRVERVFIDHSDLNSLYYELNSTSGFPRPADYAERRGPTLEMKEFHVVSLLVQVMEDVYAVAGPDGPSRGWARTLQDWSAAPAFRRAWPALSRDRPLPFRRFVAKLFLRGDNLQLQHPPPAPRS